jgi:pilus assembly protein CpaF
LSAAAQGHRDTGRGDVTTVDAALLDRVRARLAEHQAEPTPTEVARALRSAGSVVGDAAVLEVVDALRRDSLGAGPLEPLLSGAGVSDVLVNGPDLVYVDRGAGLELTDVRFADDAAVRRLAQRLAAHAGRRLDDASPFVDVRMRDGCRLHAVLAPVARPGTCISLRVPARRAMSLDELVAAGSLPRVGAALLRDLVSARAAFLVSGGTGSGKTTLLAALLSLVEPAQRIVIVEDAAELQPHHPHVVALEARQANVEGVGEIPLRVLVRQALRMRPDRLVVGEVRGAEVVDLLAAMNTGHEGGCGTVHANAAGDVPARLEALAVAAGLPRDAVHAQIAAAVQAVIHLRRDRQGRRTVTEIAVIHRHEAGLVTALPALTFTGEEPVVGPGADQLERLLANQ